jgi:hypothetical protein
VLVPFLVFLRSLFLVFLYQRSDIDPDYDLAFES